MDAKLKDRMVDVFERIVCEFNARSDTKVTVSDITGPAHIENAAGILLYGGQAVDASKIDIPVMRNFVNMADTPEKKDTIAKKLIISRMVYPILDRYAHAARKSKVPPEETAKSIGNMLVYIFTIKDHGFVVLDDNSPPATNARALVGGWPPGTIEGALDLYLRELDNLEETRRTKAPNEKFETILVPSELAFLLDMAGIDPAGYVCDKPDCDQCKEVRARGETVYTSEEFEEMRARGKAGSVADNNVIQFPGNPKVEH